MAAKFVRPPPRRIPKHAILGFQIVDGGHLLPLHPTGNKHQQELQQRCRASISASMLAA